MEVIKYVFSFFLFGLYYYLFASRYIRKYRQGGVINTNYEEKPLNITPPGLVINSVFYNILLLQHYVDFDDSSIKMLKLSMCFTIS